MKQPTYTKAVIFDFDHTLVDTRGPFVDQILDAGRQKSREELLKTALWFNTDGKPQPGSQQLKAEGKIHEFSSMSQIKAFITQRESEKSQPLQNHVTPQDTQYIEQCIAARKQIPMAQQIMRNTCHANALLAR